MKLGERLQQAWYQGHPALSLLWPLEQLYCAIVKRKRARFLSGESTTYRAPVPVIVVGNITVGGTGKTPLILWLIEHCRRQGLRVGVVSRGYGARPASLPWTVSPPIQPSRPVMSHFNVQRSGVPLVIAPERAQAVQQLLADNSIDIILSDDGLQHYGLARDIELVLIDAARGLGNQRCLPMGPLREPVERLQSVDAVVFNGAAQDSENGFSMQLQPTSCAYTQWSCEPLNYFPAQVYDAVAGIGNRRFFKTLEGLQTGSLLRMPLLIMRIYPARLTFADDLPVVMTEKDAVKCRAFAADNCCILRSQLSRPAFISWFAQRLQPLLTDSL